jgi:S-layer protein (TIGR01567 family)
VKKYIIIKLISLIVLIALSVDTASANDTVLINAFDTDYKYSGWSGEHYPVIDLFGEKYVSLLFKNENTLSYRIYKFAELVLDSDTKYTLRAGEKLDLGKGYTLEVKTFNVNGTKAWMVFAKDGQYIDDQIINVSGLAAEKTWTVALDNVQNENNIVVMKVHVNQIISNSSGNILQIDGIWLIDYLNAKTLKTDDKLGAFTLSGINGDTLIFEFNDTLLTSNEIQITNGSFTESPAIYGDRIVWHDYRNGKHGIYMYDLSTQRETKITESQFESRSPDIYGGKIVWSDNRNGNPDIYMYDLSTHQETQITTNEAEQYLPAIYGNRIVWTDNRSGNFDIYMYDLSTHQETQITTNGSNQESPDIYGNWIVWEDWRNGNYKNSSNCDIYMYDLSTSRETQITSNGSNQYLPGIYEDSIVWTDWRNGNYKNWFNSDIYIYNLSTSKERQITANEFNQYSPVIHGNMIVWEDDRNRIGTDGNNKNFDIYMHNLSTSKEIQITSNKSNQMEPVIYGNRIVWTDRRNGGFDVYLFTVSGEEIQQIIPVADFSSNVNLSYAPLSVQFNDLSKNATGINWDFENDGKVDSTNKNPVHAYTVPGYYTVKLIAFNENGIRSKLATITISERKVLPDANLSSNVSQGFAPLPVQFTDLSKNATGWNWDFENDGKIDSTSKNPVHTYSVPGHYTVNLTATNDYGKGSKLAYISVFNPAETATPVANFSTNVSQGYAPLSVRFTDLSRNATAWNWNFGDGAYSTEQNPMHTYSSAGNYIVNLIVSNGKGTNSKTSNITVEPAKILPVADFSSNTTGGYSPLFVQFSDLSQNIAARNWAFGDGTTSTEQNPMHIYSVIGTYTVNLTVINGNGTASKFSTITVLQVTGSNIENTSNNSTNYTERSDGGSSDGGSSSGGSSGGGSSGGSGGGAGGSPEPATNVEVKEISQAFVTSGNSVKFDFPQKVTPVVYVTFNSKKTAGKTTTIIEMLKGKSNLVSGLPAEDVYKSINIWVGNSGFATSNNIENAIVCFKVEKAWIQDKSVDKSSITLSRYSDNKWNVLPTNISGEDDKYLHFAAKTPGFSPFAITGKNLSKEVVTETNAKPDTKELGKNNILETVKNISEQKNNTSITGKENKSTPGFEIISGIIALLGVLLYKKIN